MKLVLKDLFKHVGKKQQVIVACIFAVAIIIVGIIIGLIPWKAQERQEQNIQQAQMQPVQQTQIQIIQLPVSTELRYPIGLKTNIVEYPAVSEKQESKEDNGTLKEILESAAASKYINNSDLITEMEKTANTLLTAGDLLNAVRSFHWLYQQHTVGTRRLTVLDNFQAASDRWEFSPQFIYDKDSPVKAIVNDTRVRIREEYKKIEDKYIIRVLEKYEEGLVLRRTDRKVSLADNKYAYWYLLSMDDGKTCGWVWGLYLMFYPLDYP
jgi:hypothetical protein